MMTTTVKTPTGTIMDAIRAAFTIRPATRKADKKAGARPTRIYLHRMDSRLLRDIGLERVDVMAPRSRAEMERLLSSPVS